ncbi:MAG: O-antigen ligase family protein [Betaproteobacteria bacterium]|nr:O-antigen ligase family protein [Betaproteobacteria bacterium]MDH5350180.1 O-antigen ligase family protein [Betaproteobacteria bacterium]
MAWIAGDRLNRAALWIAVALGFSIPVSTALDGLLLAALLVCWVAGGRFREKWGAIRGNAVALAAAAFFLLHVAGAAYSHGSVREILHALDKAATILLVPVLVSLQPGEEWRRRALVALLAALALTLALSFPVWFGVMPELDFIKGYPYDPVVFKKKIGHGVLMAFGAFVLALAAREATGARQRALLWLFAGLAAFNVFFMVWSRTGQLVLIALALHFLLVAFGRRGVLVAAAAGMVIGAAAYLIPSSSLHVRVLATVKEYNDWRAGKTDRLVNARLEAWSNSVQIVREHPLAGVGTGGFGAAYAKQVEGTSMPPLEQPENQYLLTTVQLGAVGLAALLALFALQWHLAARLAMRAEVDLARGLVILMLVGCLFNSFLSDHTQALFHAWLSGLLYAGLRPAGGRT